MGIQDRDYYGPEQPGIRLRGPSTIIGWLILINVVIALADALLTPGQGIGGLAEFMAVQPQTVVQPWNWWKFLTYGFAHASDPRHVIFNMLGLFFLGRDVEATYGRREFLRLYLVMIVLGGISWSLWNWLAKIPPQTPLVGASGAVTGVVILFVLLFPRRMLLLMFVLPVPAWVVGILFVVADLYGFIGPSGAGDAQVAYGVHLAGAGFALAYFKLGWNLTRLTNGLASSEWFKRKPRLRVHDPDRDDDSDRLAREVDRILEKMQRLGEASLTKKERRTLEEASRHYRNRRGDG
ncbi:MAG: rhomboid family intramembrane serine protease [Pirellulales bacterium]|nr:rhomboid family intramembrane serine protease [Pirellulales bacterium]